MSRRRNSTVTRAFGADNRARLLNIWFNEEGIPRFNDAWQHVYRLLLWIDATTGLSHCYESDKSQPGRPWYARSLAFHVWLSQKLGVAPIDLGAEIDWLFRHAISELASQDDEEAAQPQELRLLYRNLELPKPGDDPELVDIITEELTSYLSEPPPEHVWRRVVRQTRTYLKQENKRKNLVGEGFEDVLAAIISRIHELNHLNLSTRTLLGNVPGFHAQQGADKPKKIDLVLVANQSGHRTLVTAKWSVRADREEQFISDFNTYARQEASGEIFDHVLVTNEFDPARLSRACEKRVMNHLLFTHIVHVNPEGVLVAYGAKLKGSQKKVATFIEKGRLMSLATWLRLLANRTH